MGTLSGEATLLYLFLPPFPMVGQLLKTKIHSPMEQMGTLSKEATVILIFASHL